MNLDIDTEITTIDRILSKQERIKDNKGHQPTGRLGCRRELLIRCGMEEADRECIENCNAYKSCISYFRMVEYESK